MSYWHKSQASEKAFTDQSWPMEKHPNSTRPPASASAAATWILTVSVLIAVALQVYRFSAPQTRVAGQVLSEPSWDRLLTGGSEIRDSSASATLLPFSDYECVYCARRFGTLDSLRAEGATSRIIYRHLPNSRHRFAVLAAKASVCAERQGAFDTMNSTLFLRPATFGLEPWWASAKLAGIKDSTQFESCMSTIDVNAKLGADSLAADALKIGGTPTLFVVGVRIEEAPPTTQLLKYLDEKQREALREDR